MSERSRRRRRRRRPSTTADPQRRVERETPEGQPVAREQASAVGRSRRRRRGRSRSGGERSGSPKSSEDLVRALPRERPATLTAPPDGQTLETLIGDLQSEYGVPQYPQEYRITVKVADERAERPAAEEPSPRVAPPPTAPGNGAPRREKAPGMNTAGEGQREQAPGAPRKRSRRRRRRRGGGSGGGGGGGNGGSPPAPPS